MAALTAVATHAPSPLQAQHAVILFAFSHLKALI